MLLPTAMLAVPAFADELTGNLVGRKKGLVCGRVVSVVKIAKSDTAAADHYERYSDGKTVKKGQTVWDKS